LVESRTWSVDDMDFTSVGQRGRLEFASGSDTATRPLRLEGFGTQDAVSSGTFTMPSFAHQHQRDP